MTKNREKYDEPSSRLYLHKKEKGTNSLQGPGILALTDAASSAHYNLVYLSLFSLYLVSFSFYFIFLIGIEFKIKCLVDFTLFPCIEALFSGDNKDDKDEDDKDANIFNFYKVFFLLF